MSGDRERSAGLWLDVGELDYPAAYGIQEQLVALRRQGCIPDTIIVVEHPPCLTLGRAACREHILAGEESLAAAGITVHRSDRGGDVTYHGPGQLVFYVICDLRERGRDVHQHARRLEEVMIRTAAAFGVPCWRKLGYPGTWTAGGKLGAVGVAVRRWVTLHGAALNVSPDLAHFSLIVPCGLNDAKATSLERILGRPIDGELAREVLRDCCADVLGLDLVDAHGTDFKATVTPHGLTCPAAPLTAASRGTG